MIRSIDEFFELMEENIEMNIKMIRKKENEFSSG